MQGPPLRYAAPPAVIAAAPDVELRRCRLADAAALLRLVNDNLDYLRPWMPWAADPATPASTTAYLEGAIAAFDAGTDFGYGVWDARDGLVGNAGLHTRRGAGVLEIGYWIGEQHAGRGLGRAVARALTLAAAAVPGVQRVAICCDEANVRSAAIPRALGYDLSEIEVRPPETPGQTDRHLIWLMPVDRVPLLSAAP